MMKKLFMVAAGALLITGLAACGSHKKGKDEVVVAGVAKANTQDQETVVVAENETDATAMTTKGEY